MKIKRKLKKKYKKILLNICIFVLFVILTLSIYHVVKYQIDKNNIDGQLNNIEDKTNVKDIKDSSKTEIIKQDDNIPKSNPYWDYIKMNLIDVDFKKLKSTNHDTKGWIQVNGTNINYPFVQSNNNEYYLTHSFDKSKNSAGWVFLDYRNNLANLNDKNTIIYAHGRLDKTMFGSLKNILTSGWVNNSNNYVVKLSTEYENTLWQVFSVYRIPTTNDYIETNFVSDNSFNLFTNKLLKRSNVNFNTSVSKNDRILTLSTCYNKNDKVVLHAKLIKREIKN